MIPTEAVEAAAQALYRTEYADRDLTDALANVQSVYRADARAVLSAALPFLGAAQSAPACAGCGLAQREHQPGYGQAGARTPRFTITPTPRDDR